MLFRIFGFLLACVLLTGCGVSSEASLRAAFERNSGRIQLPLGTIELKAPLRLKPGAHDVEIVGDPGGSILRMAKDFQGKAVIVGTNVSNIRVAGFQIIGSRDGLMSNRYLPGADQT